MKMFRTILIMPFSIVALAPLFILSFTKSSISAPDEAAFYLGLGLFFVGLNFVIAVLRLFARDERGFSAPWEIQNSLITYGPYAYVRNPMVIGLSLMILGEAAFFHSWWLFLWLLVYFTSENFYIIWYDEPKLAQRFGYKYFHYLRHVNRWIPRLTPWYEGRRD